MAVKSYNTIILTILSSYFLASCASPFSVLLPRSIPTSLTGTWRTVSPDSSRFETWYVNSDSSFSGVGGLLAGNDTLVTESLLLIRQSGKWVYFATVHGQNNGKPVAFRQTRQTETSIEFSNPDHDFPKRLVYSLSSADTLQVDISGGSDFFSLRFVRQPVKP
ncbi:MAG: DUF6265 family protein [Bacteroidetes bacterium]|nr:DUF6265 family protein [Bacteroidota bacterium]